MSSKTASKMAGGGKEKAHRKLRRKESFGSYIFKGA
jgi:hypothetical protein